jgi:hypothetical protein
MKTWNKWYVYQIYYYAIDLYRITEFNSPHWAQLSMFHLKTETESSLRNVAFNKRHDDGKWPELW